MARRGVPRGPVNWYLREWMAACGLDGRGAQAKMQELTGWSKATMSQLYNGTQDYSPKVVNDAARALSIEPFELLMPPERAMALRKYQASAQEVAVSLAHEAPQAPAPIDMFALEHEEKRDRVAAKARRPKTGTHG